MRSNIDPNDRSSRSLQLTRPTGQIHLAPLPLARFKPSFADGVVATLRSGVAFGQIGGVPATRRLTVFSKPHRRSS
jgi:hypothetical protein